MTADPTKIVHPLQRAENFRQVRHVMRLSVQDVAIALGVKNERTIGRWEHGQQDIPLKAAQALSDWYLNPETKPEPRRLAAETREEEPEEDSAPDLQM